ncbi:MAG: DNA alkylation repair protein [Bacteroidales bacterium]|jgi:3-methyladenine DNA glycosylase AlkD|nr:DNA alkylation repair protein [Bacteroidales bacterium]NLD63117.1 DNA alkylation repair protein [Bacteroidales bacterium]HNT94358.1 DNA alkylation repair protein [Bacteroidales bacterium]HOO67575.1 DNA alkylation repair protein [Bacteroidales bacterium]HPE23487.1 DNA alkylation repair protein [Bacteroidales bacterium]
MKGINEKVRRELREASDEKTREQGLRYFREEVNLYGIRSKTVSEIARANYALIRNSGKDEILAICDSLWKSGMMEESFVASMWTEKLAQVFIPADFTILEKWVHNYVTNWASCDTLCNHTVGDFIQKYPEYIAELKKWAKSENRWVKRAAAVSLIIPARRGKFLADIFEIADILLLDRDDMVQKGYGWMLKEASKPYQKEVFDYVMHHKAVMPRTALRYAIEKMPPSLRAEAMEK